MAGGKSVQPLLEERREFGLQVHHPDALVGPVLVVRVQAHQEQVGHALAVVPLQNGLVRVQLQAVVPVVRVRDVRDDGIVRVVLGAERHLLDFLAALPVVNAQRAVGFSGRRVQVFKHHVDGARDAQGFVKHGPFRAIRAQPRRMVPEELQEVAEFGGFRVFHWDGQPVVMALDVVMHGRACRCGGVAVGVPGRLDCVRGHAVIRTVLPFARGHHGFDDGIRIKLAEVAVIPRGDGYIFGIRVVVNGVLVLNRFKRDARVARVRVLQLQ